jgi:uncharacterized protein YndB with AHSA1/START domain
VDGEVRVPRDRRVRPQAGRQVPRRRSEGEADPPRKLVQTWHALWDEGVAGEQPTRVTWDIEEDDGGVTRLTVTHELEGAPIHAEQVSNEARLREGGGGWSWILSDLKTLLETGKASEL